MAFSKAKMVMALAFIISFFASPRAILASEYYIAELSCLLRGNPVVLTACFENTQLEVRKNGYKNVYQAWDIQRAGDYNGSTLRVDLTQHFEIAAQNSGEYLVLELKIKDASGSLVFQEQAGQYGVIGVRN